MAGRAGCLSPSLGQVAEVHFGVSYYAEHKVVVAGNAEGGVEMVLFFIHF
jgi:hypothetical protein